MQSMQEQLNWYIEKLDSWVEESNYDSKKGVFSALSDALLVRKLAVSPNVKKPLEGLQSFLVTEVLGIHRNKASKVGYDLIRKFLAGEDIKKKYRFNFDLLPQTLDKEENKKSLLKESEILKEMRAVRGEDYLQKEIEQCEEWLPFILLDEARKVLWTKAYKYYNVCTDGFCEGCKKKKQAYYQFVQATVLFEILYLEFIQEPFNEHVKRGNKLVEQVQGEVTTFFAKIGQIHIERGNVEVIKEMNRPATERGGEMIPGIEVLEKEIFTISLFHLLIEEFARDICAMYHLLMVFEAVNVHEENRADVMRIVKVESDFRLKYGRFFESFERTNEEKSVCYRRVNEHLEMVLSRYADKQYDVAQIVIGFMEELKKKAEKKDAPHYEQFLSLLALPVYRSLGGGKE